MSKQRAVILVNLGTPATATPSAVRVFLKRFLSDPRVVEIPRVLWWLILNCFVLPLRCKRVANSYAAIWMEGGSPLHVYTASLATKLQQRFSAAGMVDTEVVYAMTYSEPSFAKVLGQLSEHGVQNFCILPLYPQYSATTTAAVYDQLARFVLQRRDLPAFHCHKDYHDNPQYILALTQSIRHSRQLNSAADCLLFSFHGIPKANIAKGDPYEKQCNRTASLVARQLGLTVKQWKISFQSRFGRAEWLQPYTVDVLQQLGADSLSVDMVSPAFATDCLETLEEINIEYRQIYQQAGGKRFTYIPCLNDDPAHVEMLFRITTSNFDF